ncbi:S9 family peptidase [Pedobacter boryungensis]|uniref:S9 family peptidase n=2 Tax=Pedobacter boryungensis TaxID=869962 RepID=A0ABX2DG77_9SPHI|nr:S9 family peptidase [Pedobacter boryungensis]
MMIWKRYVLIMLVASFFACKQGNKVAIIPVNDFFKSQDRATYHVSPDGKSLSYLKLQGKKQNLFVEDIATGKVVQLTHLRDKNINFYSWVSNKELIYYKEKAGERFQSDLYIINQDGTNERLLGNNEKSRIRVLEDQLIDDKFLLVLSNKRDSTVSDVYRLNVRDGKMEMAAQNPGNITNWVTDSRGKLRMAVSSDGVNETVLYRENEEQKFKPILTNNFKTKLFPVAFSEDKPNIVYAISNVNRDKNALIELDCTTGKEKSVLFANDTLNVVNAQYSRQKGKMAYVVYENWKKEKHYLDNDAKVLYQKLDELLPKTESRIIDRDKNENVFVVRTFTDRNPGSYYLYIVNTGTLKKLSDINSAINEDEMCEMKPISYIARDGLKINGYLTLPLNSNAKNLPVVVMPHNGPGQRNTWGFNAEVQFLANRGYAVLQVNYRGSTGYGKDFYAAGFKQWGAKIQDDVDNGVLWLINKKIANPQKIAIYGSGFGGYIALNGAIKSPKLYKCAASNSGVLNLFSYLKSIPPYFKSNLQMFYDILGNPDTDVDYMRQASPVFHADKINIPIFITQNIKDPRINSSDAIQFVKELKKRNVSVTYFENDETPFPMNREESRQRVYTALEQFLESNLKKK